MKVICMYLPQYHEIKENNKWWGKGYTEWNAVKSAVPLYKGHNQPRVPLNNNYYDLLNNAVEVWKWQASLARRYEIYGFCIYHYWFLGKQLLEKPMEILLEHPEIDINYTICWANESWTRTWYGLETEVLMKQEYGKEEDWIKHFNYMLKFFKDSRYIKKDNMPVLNIYHTFDIENLSEMLNIWNSLARENGFNGLYIISGNTNQQLEKRTNLVNAFYNFEPTYSLKHRLSKVTSLKFYARVFLLQQINKIFKKKFLERILDIKYIYKVNYKNEKIDGKPVYPATVPMWDNTPRRSYKGFEFSNTSPELFYKNLMNIKNNLSSDDDFIYINAWNEWGEGAYLEPDEKHRYQYLEAIKRVFQEK